MFKMLAGLKASAAALRSAPRSWCRARRKPRRCVSSIGDIASVESLHLLAAFERAKEKGVDIEVTYLKSEDIAAQAVVGGQADIGVGGPYALVQKVKAPDPHVHAAFDAALLPGGQRASSTRPGRI